MWWMNRDRELEDVRACHKKFGIISSDEPGHLTIRKMRERVEFLREEVSELEEAAEVQDLPAMVDALVDIVYVAKGTAVMLGLRGVWRAAWRAVQTANMSKIRGVGKRGHAVDLIKPPGWRAPDHGPILREAGYEREAWEDPKGAVMESVCRDDEPAWLKVAP